MIVQTMSRLLLVFVITAMMFTSSALGTEFSVLREEKIRRALKRLNKPAVKSINSPYGDIIDCVRLTDQPVFDHPLLKNHTIQLRPSFYPEGVYAGKEASWSVENEPRARNQLWRMNGECPENTIPIRRTTREDLLRADSIEEYGRKTHQSIFELRSSQASNTHEMRSSFYPEVVSTGNEVSSIIEEDLLRTYSIVDYGRKNRGMNPLRQSNTHEYAQVGDSTGNFHGTQVTLNLWNPKVQANENEFSLAQFWITAGDYSTNDLNTIEVGWQVYPNLYNDDKTRLFIYWTRDAYQSTGCYNLLCSGFVQTTSQIYIGQPFTSTSTYNGPQEFVTILVWKDPNTRNWWLQVDGMNLGYWPASLFTRLADRAAMVSWGGEIVNEKTNGQHTTTEMGSGHFAEEGFGRASNFNNIKVVDSFNALREPNPGPYFVSFPDCYNFKWGSQSSTLGTNFYFGGPGRNANCP